MTITPDSPLVGPPSGTLHAALDYAGTENAEYVNEVWRLALLVGIDPAILVAQSAHETYDWTSLWWDTRINPAGIGITGDPAQNAASQIWANQTDAARGHVLHMCAYVFGNLSGDKSRSSLMNFWQLDQRWNAVFDADYERSVVVIRDLTGKWAADPLYHDGIIRKHRAIFGAGGTEPVGSPVIYDLMTDYARFGISQEDAATVRGYRFENRSGYKPSFIVLHIQVGTTRSSLDWWANGYVDGRKVTASSTVMIQKDGSILNVIPEKHGPWTNGDDRQPTANGQRLVNLPGNSNLHTLSIEAEGMSGADVLADADQLDAIEWQVRDWQTKYNIPNANVIRHGDVNSIDKANCPGAYYAEIMKRITGEDPVPQPTTAPIWWTPGDIGIQKREDGAIAIAMLGEIAAVKGASLYASVGGAKIGSVPAGTKLKIVGTHRAANGVRWAFVERDGQYPRVRYSSFAPKFPTL